MSHTRSVGRVGEHVPPQLRSHPWVERLASCDTRTRTPWLLAHVLGITSAGVCMPIADYVRTHVRVRPPCTCASATPTVAGGTTTPHAPTCACSQEDDDVSLLVLLSSLWCVDAVSCDGLMAVYGSADPRAHVLHGAAPVLTTTLPHASSIVHHDAHLLPAVTIQMCDAHLSAHVAAHAVDAGVCPIAPVLHARPLVQVDVRPRVDSQPPTPLADAAEPVAGGSVGPSAHDAADPTLPTEEAAPASIPRATSAGTLSSSSGSTAAGDVDALDMYDALDATSGTLAGGALDLLRGADGGVSAVQVLQQLCHMHVYNRDAAGRCDTGARVACLGEVCTSQCEYPHTPSHTLLPPHMCVVVSLEGDVTSRFRFHACQWWWERTPALTMLCEHAYGGDWRAGLMQALTLVAAQYKAPMGASGARRTGLRSRAANALRMAASYAALARRARMQHVFTSLAPDVGLACAHVHACVLRSQVEGSADTRACSELTRSQVLVLVDFMYTCTLPASLGDVDLTALARVGVAWRWQRLLDALDEHAVQAVASGDVRHVEVMHRASTSNGRVLPRLFTYVRVPDADAAREAPVRARARARAAPRAAHSTAQALVPIELQASRRHGHDSASPFRVSRSDGTGGDDEDPTMHDTLARAAVHVGGEDPIAGVDDSAHLPLHSPGSGSIRRVVSWAAMAAGSGSGASRVG